MMRDWGEIRLLFVTAMVAVVACTAPVVDSPPAARESTSGPLDIGLIGRIHFNTQAADFVRARTFYRMLGFTVGVGGFPKTNTHEMARSLGMDDLCSYEIQEIEVISIPDSWGPRSIDLIQFAAPFNPEPALCHADTPRNGLYGAPDHRPGGRRGPAAGRGRGVAI